MTDQPSPYRETVERNWNRARPFIEDALEYADGTHTVEDVLDGILRGSLQLWIGERCAAVSEVLSYPRKRALNMFLAGGDLRELQGLVPGVEAFARARGCSTVMATARLTAGAQRRLPKLVAWVAAFAGYVPGHILCTKELR